jgi:hypothetical protein
MAAPYKDFGCSVGMDSLKTCLISQMYGQLAFGTCPLHQRHRQGVRSDRTPPNQRTTPEKHVMTEIIERSLRTTPFPFEGNQLRTMTRDGEPWFVATDVCDALGLDRTQIRRLDDDERGVCSIHTLGGTQKMIVVNESGLYSLIMGSRKPEAKKFKKWVTSEVLPSIRKTGSYSKHTLSTLDILTLAIENEKGRLLAIEQRHYLTEI